MSEMIDYDDAGGGYDLELLHEDAAAVDAFDAASLAEQYERDEIDNDTTEILHALGRAGILDDERSEAFDRAAEVTAAWRQNPNELYPRILDARQRGLTTEEMAQELLGDATKVAIRETKAANPPKSYDDVIARYVTRDQHADHWARDLSDDDYGAVIEAYDRGHNPALGGLQPSPPSAKRQAEVVADGEPEKLTTYEQVAAKWGGGKMTKDDLERMGWR